MAALFVTLRANDIFQSGIGGASHLINIPSLEGLASSMGLAVYDSITVQIGETIQYFLTFDDVIKYIHFGKGVGTVNVEGTMFSDCSGDVPGLGEFTKSVSGLRGKSSKVSLGGAAFTVIMTHASVTVIGEPQTMGKFSFTFSIVNHSL